MKYQNFQAINKKRKQKNTSTRTNTQMSQISHATNRDSSCDSGKSNHQILYFHLISMNKIISENKWRNQFQRIYIFQTKFLL
ncbi:hypothetical protein L6452_04558 [Arctium lappa]|uniref:Uncharacterized protein n=1 Tax=Arctium lappa TaxID=4217 RepID=A0ACB9EEC0_ARCLA|nr:hypothetical protein L6452_04558 [Arctium lappa]